LKENIEPIDEDEAEQAIMNVKTYSFNLKRDKTKHKRFGVIAQELREILPELVYGNDDDENEYLGVDYTGLIPLMINTIKKQRKEINEMNERLKKLESLLC
jgi:hypothetical protein